MGRYVSTFTNRIDAKGRVSIPAPFRLALVKEGAEQLYCCPTLDMQAVDAGGKALQGRIDELLSAYPPFSEDYEYFSTALLGDSEELKIDGDGRVVLSDTIRNHAGLDGKVTFVGQGYKFQLWNPERFEVFREESRSRVRALRKNLGNNKSATAVIVEGQE